MGILERIAEIESEVCNLNIEYGEFDFDSGQFNLCVRDHSSTVVFVVLSHLLWLWLTDIKLKAHNPAL